MEQRYSSTLSLTSALDGCGWSTPRPGRFTSGKDPAPIVQEAGWAPRPVWKGAENSPTTGVRPPDRPARSESLNRLSYPGPRHSILRVLYKGQCFCSVVNRHYKTTRPLTAVCHHITRHHSKTICSRRVHAQRRLSQFFAQCHKTEMDLYSPTVKALLIWTKKKRRQQIWVQLNIRFQCSHYWHHCKRRGCAGQ